MIVECNYCSKELRRKPSRYKNKRAFCNASEQMLYEYSNGDRDPVLITVKARESAHKRQKEDNWLNYDESRDKLREVMDTDDYREKLRNSKIGSKSYNYKGGKTNWWNHRKFKRLKVERLKLDNYSCVHCGITDVPLDCDHVVPYAVCKRHDLDNLQMLCRSCHSKKTVEDVRRFGLRGLPKAVHS